MASIAHTVLVIVLLGTVSSNLNMLTAVQGQAMSGGAGGGMSSFLSALMGPSAQQANGQGLGDQQLLSNPTQQQTAVQGQGYQGGLASLFGTPTQPATGTGQGDQLLFSNPKTLTPVQGQGYQGGGSNLAAMFGQPAQPAAAEQQLGLFSMQPQFGDLLPKPKPKRRRMPFWAMWHMMENIF